MKGNDVYKVQINYWCSYQMFVETVNILQNISDIDIICTKPFYKSRINSHERKIPPDWVYWEEWQSYNSYVRHECQKQDMKGVSEDEKVSLEIDEILSAR